MLKIVPEALAFQLNKGLSPFYLLTGQDLLLVDECKLAITQAAKAFGFDEKIEVTIGHNTAWEDIFESVQSVGLFSPKQIIVLNLPDSILAAQQKKLIELLAFSNPDLLFIFHVPKFTKTIEKQAWYQQASDQLLQINCQTPDITKLPQWIVQRATKMDMTLDEEAIQLLAFNYEGNLLALKQSLDLLRLTYADGKISLNRAKEIVEQSAQFTPFQWVDSLLEGKTNRAIRILHHLKATGDAPPVLLLGIIKKELLLLLEITRSPQAIQSHLPLYRDNLRQEFDRLKIWQNRRILYQQVIARLTYAKLFALIRHLANLERKIKQEFSDDIWREFERLSFLFK